MVLFQKLAKSEEEDVVGNYFKPHRASRLMAQAQETQKGTAPLKTFCYGTASEYGHLGLKKEKQCLQVRSEGVT